MASSMRLNASEEEGGFIADFPNFGIGVTQGDDREEALAQADDLLETMVANYMAEGWDLPEPSPARGRSFVRLASLVAAKAEVYRAMRQTGIDKAELARPGAVPAWRRCGGGGQRRTDPVLVQRGIASLPVRHCVQARTCRVVFSHIKRCKVELWRIDQQRPPIIVISQTNNEEF